MILRWAADGYFDIIAVVILLAIFALNVVNTFYVRRTNQEQFRLLRKQSDAITWLVEDAKLSIDAKSLETQEIVKEGVRSVKRTIEDKLPEGGSHEPG